MGVGEIIREITRKNVSRRRRRNLFFYLPTRTVNRRKNKQKPTGDFSKTVNCHSNCDCHLRYGRITSELHATAFRCFRIQPIARRAIVEYRTTNNKRDRKHEYIALGRTRPCKSGRVPIDYRPPPTNPRRQRRSIRPSNVHRPFHMCARRFQRRLYYAV